jgi:signal transduction histidine kinase
MLAEQGATVALEVDRSTPAARFDARSLRQVVVNLLDNAARHGGGSIRVRVRGQADRVAIDVDDDGPGLSEDVRHRVLRRGQESLPRPDGGLGIGLALSRSLARAMNGELVCGDSRSGGARLTVTLPAEPGLILDTPD